VVLLKEARTERFSRKAPLKVYSNLNSNFAHTRIDMFFLSKGASIKNMFAQEPMTMGFWFAQIMHISTLSNISFLQGYGSKHVSESHLSKNFIKWLVALQV